MEAWYSKNHQSQPLESGVDVTLKEGCIDNISIVAQENIQCVYQAHIMKDLPISTTVTRSRGHALSLLSMYLVHIKAI